MKSLTAFVAITSLSAIVLSTPAAAAQDWLQMDEPTTEGVHSARIRIDDIDVASKLGQNELKSRVHRAAMSICSRANYEESFYSGPTGPRSRCMHETMRAARSSIDETIASARTGNRIATLRLGVRSAAP